MTGIEAFESAGTLVIEARTVPTAWKCEVLVTSRGVEQYARPSILEETEHQSSVAVLSRRSSSCGRPRAQTQSEQSQVRCTGRPKPKLQRCEFKHNSKHITRYLRHGGCAHGLSILGGAGSSQDWNKEQGLTHSVVQPTNPEWTTVRKKRNDSPHPCIARGVRGSWEKSVQKESWRVRSRLMGE